MHRRAGAPAQPGKPSIVPGPADRPMESARDVRGHEIVGLCQPSGSLVVTPAQPAREPGRRMFPAVGQARRRSLTVDPRCDGLNHARGWLVGGVGVLPMYLVSPGTDGIG